MHELQEAPESRWESSGCAGPGDEPLFFSLKHIVNYS